MIDSLLMILSRLNVVITAGQVIHLLPEAASEQATEVDTLFWALVAFCGVVMLILFAAMLCFAYRYRAGSSADRTGQVRRTMKIELAWTGAALLIVLVLFVWGGSVFIRMHSPPADAAVYYVTGRQWMWEVRHPDGLRELNTLHLPIGEPAKIILASEDVIHSFYIPAFRIKQDAVPGRFTTTWFTPNRVGEYHLFCAEYCGTDHSRMTGKVTVMERTDYERWRRITPSPPPTAQPLGVTEDASFRALGCNQCHRPDSEQWAPRLEGLFGRSVKLRDGDEVVADEQYIRESILDPAAKVVRGYQPIMPTYKGMLSERQIGQLIEAIRALPDLQDVGMEP